MDNYKVDKLEQHSKANRARGMINIRARNQKSNIYQSEEKDHVRIPQKVERRAHNQHPSMIQFLPTNISSANDNFISG